MLREHTKFLNYLRLALDITLTVLAFTAAYHIRAGMEFFNLKYGPLQPIAGYHWLLFVVVPLWVLLFNYFNLYSSMRTEKYLDILIKITKPFAVGTLVLVALVFALKFGTDMSRTFLMGFILLNYLLILSEQIFAKLFITFVRKKGFNYRNMLIVGTDKTAVEFAQLLNKHQGWGIQVIGFVNPDTEAVSDSTPRTDINIIGNINEIQQILDSHVVDEVLFSVPLGVLEKIQNTILKCELMGVKVHIKADFVNLILSETHLQDFYGVPILTYTTTPHNVAALFLKRAFDIIFSAGLLILLSPLMLIIAILIKLTSDGEVIFRQSRCGLSKRIFTLYKFRSMCENADQLREELEHLNEMNGPVFKAGNDPRITKLGRFIRRLSIDELPQLWNVLKGDMSIVGPRPPLPEEVEQYETWQKRRLSMKPGLTCLWQVSGRSNIDFEDWMKLDLEYIDNWSLSLDMQILIKTIPAVLLAKGAK